MLPAGVPAEEASPAPEVDVELLELLELPEPLELLVLLELLELPEAAGLVPGALAAAVVVPVEPVVVEPVVAVGAAALAGVSLLPPHEASKPDARSVNRILFFSNIQDNLSSRV